MIGCHRVWWHSMQQLLWTGTVYALRTNTLYFSIAECLMSNVCVCVCARVRACDEGELHGDLLWTRPRSAEPEEQEQLKSSWTSAARSLRRRFVETGGDLIRRHQRPHWRGKQSKVHAQLLSQYSELSCQCQSVNICIAHRLVEMRSMRQYADSATEMSSAEQHVVWT